jgi:putative hydrolase of the HAD superfamily
MALAFALTRVVYFDAVGTLIHPEPAAPVVYACIGRRFGSRLEEPQIAARFRAAFRRQEEADYASGLRTSEKREVARWRAIVREVLDDVTDTETCFQTLYEHFARAEAWRCESETAEVLPTLAARGHVLGIASNFDQRLRGLLEQIPALRSVRDLVISSEIGWRKPAGNFFARMCRQAGSAPEDVLHVGDDFLNDYEGARAAGLRAVLLAPQAHATVPATACLKSLNDLVL